MQPIVAPLNPQDSGVQVANLQDGLRLLLDRGVIRAVESPNRPTVEDLAKLGQSLAKERAQSTYRKATENLLRYFQLQEGLGDDLRGAVESKTASRLNEILKALGALDDGGAWSVKGRVTQGGKPLNGIRVQAFDRDLRKRQPLGSSARTEPDGTYEITYRMADFARGDRTERPTPWLVVVATRAEGGTTAEAEKARDVQRHEVVDISFAPVPTNEFAQLLNAVRPLLDGQGENDQPLPPWELTEDDVAFLSTETELDRERVRLWILAARTARDVKLLETAATGSTGREVSTDDFLEWFVFYGWFREGHPTTLTELIAVGPETLIESLRRAITANRIAALTEEQLKRVGDALRQRRVAEALKPEASGQPASLGTLLTEAGGTWLTEEIRLQIAPVLLETDVESEDFHKSLGALMPDEAQRRDLRRTLRLGELTMRHPAMVKALRPVTEASDDDTLRGLVSLEPVRWLDLAYQHGAPPLSPLTPEDYAHRMEEEVERLMPAAVLVSRLKSHPFFSETQDYVSLIPILEESPGFDPETGDVESFARERGLSDAQQTSLRRLQHLKRLGARWHEAGTLLERGIDSVATVVELGPEGFKAEMHEVLPEERIENIYGNSQARHTASVGLMGLLQPLLFTSTGAALRSSEEAAATQELIAQSPTLRNLFGSLESCACDPCLSVLSPAAYFVDLLKYVGASPEAASELQRRRPDLYDLELSCDNTRIEVLYIDLVNEILENQVALPLEVALSMGVNAENELQKVPLGASVQAQLQRTALEPLRQLTADEDVLSGRRLRNSGGASFWTVTDQHRRWSLRAASERLWLQSPAFEAGVDIGGLNMADVVTALNHGTVHPTLRERFEKALVDIQRPSLPVWIEGVKIAQAGEGHWTINYSLVGNAMVQAEEGTLALSTQSGVQSTVQLSSVTIKVTKASFDNGQVAPVLRALDPVLPPKLSITQGAGRWGYSSTHSAHLFYRPGLRIIGLTYQSTAPDRDLLARPQNRNPLAYSRLNAPEVRFPWTLPYDADLTATRALLAQAGTSRLELLRAFNPDRNRSTTPSIAREMFGLSVEQEARIRTKTQGDTLWTTWGLKLRPSGGYEVFDSFEDKIVTGTALTLLGRVSVLMQQARVSFIELQQLLAAKWVNPDGVPISPDHLCDPTKLTVAVTETLLDRLHRFVRLWRATGWQIWELDQALRSRGIATDPLTDATFRNLADLNVLRSRIEQPLEILLTWFAGEFTNEPHFVERQGELLEAPSLYGRLFHDSLLDAMPDPAMAFNRLAAEPVSLDGTGGTQPPVAQPPVAQPPGVPNLGGRLPPTLRDKAPLLAAVFGLRETVLGALIESPDIDKLGVSSRRFLTNGNLAWLCRNAILMKIRRLPAEEYQAAWRVRGGEPFSSPGALLEFLDDLDLVRGSGTTWRVLEHVLQGSDLEEAAFPTTQAAEILGTIQGSLSAEPESPAADAYFGLTAEDLDLPAAPTSAAERWRRWGLTEVQADPEETPPEWTVTNPDSGGGGSTLRGQPMELLSRMGVLAQQLQATAGDVRRLLETRFVSPDGSAPPTVTEAPGNRPGLIVTGLTETHLDRLEGMAALWRRAGVGIRELDLMIRAVALRDPNKTLSETLTTLVGEGPALVALRDRLGVALDTVIAWMGGLPHRRYAPGGTEEGEDPGVFERLFGGIPELRMASGGDQLEIEANPPTPKMTWKGLSSSLAGKLNVPASELDFLVVAGLVPPEVTLKNLESLHRIVTLSIAMGLSTREFERVSKRFARSQGGDWWNSAVSTLKFATDALEEQRRSAAVASLLATAFQLDAAVVADLLWDGLNVAKGTAEIPAMEQFLDSSLLKPNAVVDAITLAAAPEHAVLARLHKLSLLNAGWKATPTELRWLWKEPHAGGRFAGLSPNDLPVAAKGSPRIFEAWRQTTALFALAHSLPPMSALLGAYLAAVGTGQQPAEIQAAWKVLGVAFGQNASTAAEAVAGFATLLGLTVPANPPAQLDPLWLKRLYDLLRTTQRLGLDADAYKRVTADPPTAASVAAATAVLRSCFDDAAWPKALREANEALRVEDRDRLVDHLVWREGVRNADALYERYLIDVQMGACMKTTRLLQSIAAVQLFVQRCLLNLEQPHVPPGSIRNRERWDWMRSYRVWEANRRVFLYPENWLHPELRDDRTETFRAFESALTQSEPSHENAAAAAIQYLEALIEVNQISVRGMHEDADPQNPGDSDLYLVGRSPNAPSRSYWRKSQSLGGKVARWTGWEGIDQEISDDHVIPFVLGGDLHLAWPLINQFRDEQGDRYEVQLAWSRKTATHWTPRKKTREPLRRKKLFNRDERSMFAFRLLNDVGAAGGGQRIGIEVLEAKDPEENVTIPNPKNEAILTKPWTQELSTFDSNGFWRLQIQADCFVVYRSGRAARAPLSYKMYGIRWNPEVGSYDQGEATDIVHVGGWNPHEIPLFGPLTSLTLEAYGFGMTPKRVSVDPIAAGTGMGGRAIITVHFVFDDVADPPSTESDRNKRLPMLPLGFFAVEHTNEVGWHEAGGAQVEPLPNALFWSSGYREVESKSIGPFTPAFGEPMFVLSGPRASANVGASQAGRPNKRASGSRLYYVEEGDRRLVARVSEPFQNVVEAYPCGYGDAEFYRRLARSSLESLFDLPAQQKGMNSWFDVDAITKWLGRGPVVDDLAENTKTLGFDLRMPNAIYNWEVFYHLPVAAATFLSRQQRFEDARRWFHYVFDPTTNDAASGRERFWRFLPFRHAVASATTAQLLETLAGRPNTGMTAADAQQHVAAWLADPFNPFSIARLRPSAFEWYTVISYVKNLVSWADQLFRRDTREAIDEAALLYVLAARILGRRPERIGKRGAQQRPLSYRALQGRWDELGNAWLSLADGPLVQAWTGALKRPARHGVSDRQAPWDRIAQLSSIGSLYFCVPPNEKLLELWDTVEDRLFKIRHCQNIEGVRRELPFFEPPIDPELLIRARAAGLELADVLADRFAPLPYQRFQVLLQKALEFCGEVRSLGAGLLSALEKKEAEQLARLRSQQELEMLRRVEQVREDQVREAKANLEALQKTRSNTVARLSFLQRQLGKIDVTLDATGVPVVEQGLITQVQESGAPDDFRSLALVQAEIDQVWRMQEGHIASVVGGAFKLAASGARVTAAGLKSYSVTAAWGDAVNYTGQAFADLGDLAGLVATNASFWERRASLIAGWQRRRDEWVQQSMMTAEEIRQIDRQIIALEIRKAIAEKDLENHRKQIEFATSIDDFLRHLKFTGESLYTWMEGQLAGVHFSAYQMAYDLARRAERAFRFELGDEAAAFVQFGHWDNLRRGLLAGERLANDLRRMDAAYLERNRRDLEITKHISLRQLDPEALLKLRAQGNCEFEIPESLFDLDFPGHYFRRIKSVSLTVPCVVGPYTGVSGTLTLLSSRVRERNRVVGDYSNEANYRASFLPIQSIATSSGQNDSGLFELNFRDERYLPFEGAGVISRWRFRLPESFHAFDYGTIPDLVLHLRYTARDGGAALEPAASRDLTTRLNALTHNGTTGLVALISPRQDFPSEWRRYKDQHADLKLKLTDRFFPYMFRSRVKPQSAALVWSGAGAPLKLKPDDGKLVGELPTYTVPYAEGAELLRAENPHLLVTYQV